jgi:uncharacterized protein YbjT (DUF2867 family)
MQTNNKLIVVAGATGNLGGRIIKNLVQRKANVRALVRIGTEKSDVAKLVADGAEVVEVDYQNPLSLTHACLKASCVVSALSGLRDVIVDAQSNLLDAAIEAGVNRFIPSDYCIDYRKLKSGTNRNLDIRREFSEILSKASIKGTSILNGMFMDLLLDEAPVILFKQKRIFFWGDADQKMDFTSIKNTAEYTAAAALDDHAPRWLTIAGEMASMRDLQRTASEVTGEKFKLFRPGGLGAFRLIIKITKTFAPGKNETFPAWQGMQYLHDMLTGLPKFTTANNQRYEDIRWQKVGDIIRQRK